METKERAKLILNKAGWDRLFVMETACDNRKVLILGWLQNPVDGKVEFVPCARVLTDEEILQLKIDGKNPQYPVA